jgi:Protein of unknown function (DUF1579)
MRHLRRRRAGLPALLLPLLIVLAAPGLLRCQESKPAALPTIDQATARYATARGGLANWQAVRSLAFAGTYTSFSVDAPFTLERLRPDRYRFDSTTLRLPFTHGHDAGGSWWIFPPYGIEWAQRTVPPDAGLIAREAELEPPLLRWREKGHKAEVVGRGEIDGQETLDLRLTRKDGAVETWHLDPATFLEVAVDSTVWDFTQRGDSMPQRAYFSDFRPVEGVVLPFRIEKEYGARHTVMAVDKVTVGKADGAQIAEAAEARFRMPLPSGMEPLRALAGSWDLTVETPAGPPDAPWQAVQTVSTITPLFEGALLEERFTLEQDGVRSEVVRTRSWDRFTERYRFTHFDGATAHLNVFDGALADGKLTADNLATGTARKEGGATVHERQVISEIAADGFRVDWERSADAGKTWEPVARQIYKRRPAAKS